MEKSFADYLRDLVLFCSAHDALKWKEIWTTWTYSEAVDFGLQLSKHKAEQSGQLNAIQDPLAFIMTLLLQRIK